MGCGILWNSGHICKSGKQLRSGEGILVSPLNTDGVPVTDTGSNDHGSCTGQSDMPVCNTELFGKHFPCGSIIEQDSYVESEWSSCSYLWPPDQYLIFQQSESWSIFVSIRNPGSANADLRCDVCGRTEHGQRVVFYTGSSYFQFNKLH